MDPMNVIGALVLAVILVGYMAIISEKRWMGWVLIVLSSGLVLDSAIILLKG